MERSMPKISFNISDDLLLTLNENESELTNKIKLYAALQLFKEHKLTIGQAAELAGMSKYDFMRISGKYDIPIIDYNPSDLEDELKSFL